MIRIEIQMDPSGQGHGLAIRASDDHGESVPDPIVFAVVTAAYHELLSKKIRDDFDNSVRIVRGMPPSAGRN